MHGRILQAAAIIMTFALLITGCTSEAFNIGVAKDKENNVVDTGFSVSTVGSYDSADTAVVMSVDQENNCVVFMNMDAGKQYTLYYDGTTYVTDKYDGPMTISQIRAGDVVDVNFLKGKRQLASIKQSPSAWVYENIDNYDLGGINKTANIGSSTYSLPDEAVILSEGKRVEVMDVVAQDRVTIRGVDRQIYSVNVERGHGYLRLRNEQALIGGWIEVGNTVIREITEDMLLVVPEGSYQVALSNGGASSVKDVVIERDRETVLDVGDIEIVKDKTGKILFSVSPAGAEVTIDGNLTDISSAVELPYGIHQIHMEAEGYDSLTKYIQVGSEYAKISFELEEKVEEETPTISGNTLEQETEQSTIPELEYAPVKDPVTSVSENTISPTQSNKVYIDAPKDVEVYVDSNYIGIAPISFKKSVGSHTVTLRKAGYKTRSYTIYLYNDGEDVTYSFTELEREETETVSGNDLSSSTNSSKTSSSGDGEKPTSSSSATQNPPSSGGDAENPSGGSTENPSGGSTENPSGGSTENPSGGSTENPSGGSTENPSGGSTENPSGGSTENPSGGSTENPSGGSTENPSGGSTENPSGGSTENPSGGSTENSSNGSTENSSGGNHEGSIPESSVTSPKENEKSEFSNINSVFASSANLNNSVLKNKKK